MTTATKEKPKQITIDNVGPVEHLAIPLPVAGGVIVLTGSNGAGKSESLNAVESVIRGKGSLEKRDGSAAPGKVDGLGVRLVVGKNTRREGELSVYSIEDKLSLATLVDPKVSDPRAADAKRIKAILALTGEQVDIHAFDKLLGDQLIKFIGNEAKAATDPLELGTLVKRDAEAAARRGEAKITELKAKVNALNTNLALVDLESPHNEKALREAHTAAVEKAAELRAQRQAAEAAAVSARNAADNMALAKKQYAGLSILEATTEVMAAQARKEKAVEAVRVANLEYDSASTALVVANSGHKAAKAHADYIAQCETLLVPPAPGPTDAQVEEAINAITTASRALEIGAMVRLAKIDQQEVEKATKELTVTSTFTTALRQVAQGVDGVLSGLVKCKTLEVADGRLVAVGHKRGKPFYADLSQGERVRIAIDLIIDAVGDGSLLCMPQELWDALDPANKSSVAAHVAKRQCWMLTASAYKAGELKAEIFEGEKL